MLVRDIMSSPVITVAPETSIQGVAQTMRDHHISCVPVVTVDGQLVGIVTEVDLISRHAPAQEPQYLSLLWAVIPLRIDDYVRYKEQVRQILATNAEQLMTRKLTSIRADASVEEAAALMVQPGHSALPVVDNGQLVGIVTRTDLVQMIESLELSQE
jgi:CBS domain-containing protein